MYTFKSTLLFGFIVLFAKLALSCNYTVELYDSYGDGWNGGKISIYVNGTAVLSDITLSSGYGPDTYTFNVNSGDTINSIYTAGNWSNENYYYIQDPSGNVIFTDGCTDQTCSPSGGLVGVGNCPANDLAVTWDSPLIACGLTNNTSISIRVLNNGTSSQSGYTLSYSINNGLTFVNETVNTPIIPGDTIQYTFNTTAAMAMYQTYRCIAAVYLNTDQIPGNDTTDVFNLVHTPTISSFPYNQTFENGPANWYSGGTNSSWQFGTPAGSVIDSAFSGDSAWATNLSGYSNTFEYSYVESPCFNFSTLVNPEVEFSYWCHTDEWDDGAALQYTTDGINWYHVGAYNNPTAPPNWYNNEWLYGLSWAGNQDGWSGNSGGWKTTSHNLGFLAGESFVKFRVIFGENDGYVGNYEGFAFDDFRIYQPPNMAYSWSAAFQSNLLAVPQGGDNQEILGMQIVTSGSTNPLQLYSMHFNSTGSSNTNDIDSAKLYYSGTDTSFSTALSFGIPVAVNSPFSFYDTLSLSEDTNYFWLAYQLTVNATPGNYIDARFDSMNIAGNSYTPLNAAPAGNRQIIEAMSGIYSINPSGGDYPSFSAAVNALKLRGVKAPVIFNVASGSYNEQLIIPEITGSSSTNTITFKSAANDSSAVILSYSATNMDSNYTVYLNGADNILFKNLSLLATGTNYARVIQIDNGSNNVQLVKNHIRGKYHPGTSTYYALLYSLSGIDNDLVIQNNLFSNGSYAIFSMSSGSLNPETGHIFSGNNFIDQYYMSICMYYSESAKIQHNYFFSSSPYSYYYAIFGYNLTRDFKITENTIIKTTTGGYGIYFYGCGGYSSARGLVANNMVSFFANGNNIYGIYADNSSYTDIHYNSINIYGNYVYTYALRLFASSYCDIRNNNICNQAYGYSYYSYSSTDISSDYNNIYSNSSNKFAYINSTSCQGFSDFLTNAGTDSNSVSVYPNFISDTNLHTYSFFLNSAADPVSTVTTDIDGDIRNSSSPDIGADEFDLPNYEAAIVSIDSPLSGCGLGNETVSILIANLGSNTISGNITATYAISGGATVNQSVPGSISPGDTIIFSFSTQANLSVSNADSTFEISCYISLSGDSNPANDTMDISVVSGYIPTDPVPVHDTVQYGNPAHLSVISNDTCFWFDQASGGTEIAKGNSFTTPVLYDTTTYYAEAWSGYPDLKITEIVQYGAGTGNTPSLPSYVTYSNWDGLEITNLGNAPADMSGYTMNISGSPNLTYTFPNGISLGGGEIMVLSFYGSMTDDPANNFYVMSTFSGNSSGSLAGYYLKDDFGKVIDAVATNGYSFPVSTGVTATDWSGSITSSSGRAGVIRFNSDNNTAADWAIAGSPSTQTIGSLNPGLTTSSGSGFCASNRVAVQAIVTNIPPLGIPSIDPDSFNISFTNCIDSATFPYTIYNSGTGDLIYSTVGGTISAFDSTSTQYYYSSGATTNHIFQSVPTYADTIHLTVTLNGDYTTYSSEYATLFVEGGNKGIINTSSISDGTDYVRSYILTGSELNTWLADGELSISILNSSGVDYGYGQSRHDVRVLINANEWIELPANVDTISPGDSAISYVTFKSENLNNGTYNSYFLINFNTPISPQIHVPCIMNVNGFPEISLSTACLNFDTTLQFAMQYDTLIIYNSGCDALLITSISSSDNDFTSSWTSNTIQPYSFDTLVLAFHPQSVKTYNDTLYIQNNASDTFVCLSATSLSPPIMNFSTDTLYAYIQHCDDSLLQTFTIYNNGSQNLEYEILNAKDTSLLSCGILASDNSNYVSDVQLKLLASGKFSSVNIIDIGSTTPNLNDMLMYDVVLLWHNYSISDPSLLGNYLADYVDAGGGVVCAIFTTAYTNLSGRFDTDNYWAIDPQGTVRTGQAGLGAIYDQNHPVLNGVHTFDGGYYAYRPYYNTIASSASRIADWSDGYPLIATTYVNGVPRCDLGFYPPSTDVYSYLWNSSTDGDIILANALEWVSYGGVNWLNFSKTFDTVTPGSFSQVQVEFNAAGMNSGNYSLPVIIHSNDPLKTIDTVIFIMEVDGEAEIVCSDTCLPFDSIMQGAVDDDTLFIVNNGCDTLLVNNIQFTSSSFYASASSLDILPGDTASLIVSFNPVSTGAFQDTLYLFNNDTNLAICLSGFSFPAPSVSVYPTSISVTMNTCNDSTYFPLMIYNTGAAPLVWIGSAGDNLEDDFDPDIDMSYWSGITGGFASDNCGFNSGSKALYFNGDYSREAITYDLNVASGGDIDFYLKIGSSVSGSNCETADNGEDIVLEYSVDGGNSWTIINTYYTGYYNNFTHISENIPIAAKTTSTRFRWRQITHSGSCCDHWSLDDINMNVSTVADSGTLAVGDSTIFLVPFNAQGLNTGTYQSAVYISSNDPVNPLLEVPTTLVMNGYPVMQLSDQCLLMDTIIQGFSTTDTLYIYNTGCDNLHISSISNSLSEFSLDKSSLSIPAGDTAQLVVTFAPSSVNTFQDTIYIISNDVDIMVCLHGVGVINPVITVVPDSFNVNLSACDDSLVKQLTIKNEGLGDLIFDIPALYGWSYDSTSTITYTTSGASTTHSFHLPYNMADSVKILVTLNGDFDYSSEYAVLSIEGTSIGQINDGNVTNGTAIVNEYVFDKTYLSSWLIDNTIDVSLTNSIEVNVFSGLGNYHEVRLIIDGIEWISLTGNGDTLLYNDSITMDVKFDGSGLNAGTYHSQITVNSNDPNNTQLHIPCVFEISGSPEIFLADTCLNFGQITQNTFAADTLQIINTGCDTLFISSITNNYSVFTPDTSSLSILPHDTSEIQVIFSPVLTGTYSDVLYLYNNASDTSICLSGVSVDAASAEVYPDSLAISMNCFDTISAGIYIKNTGLGNLVYKVRSGYGLAGDSSVLIIQDATPYGVDLQSFLITNFNIIPVIIASSQIDATDFSAYDLIMTCSDQSSMYYNALSNYKTKFEHYVAEGGMLQYNLANYSMGTIPLVNGANMIAGNYDYTNIIQTSSHALFNGISSNLSGSYANTNYISNLPSNAVVHATTNNTALPTIAEYTYGLGNVLVSGMPWEYQMTTFNNTSDLLYNSVAYELSLMHHIPAWIQFSTDFDSISAADSVLFPFDFYSSSLTAGDHYTQFYVATNDPLNPQIEVPCTLSLLGSAEIALSATYMDLDTALQNAINTSSFTVINEGCDDLVISNMSTVLPDFYLNQYAYTIQPGDSVEITVNFQPSVTGSFYDTLNIYSNVSDTFIILTGYGGMPPVISVVPDSFNISFTQCNDSLMQTMWVINTGATELIYDFQGFFGQSYDITQTSYISYSGQTTSHTFTGLPLNADSLYVIVTISGDYDQTNEYATLNIDGTLLGTINDNNVMNGTNVTNTYIFTSASLMNWLSDGTLVVTIANNSNVDVWSGLNSMHQVKIVVKGNEWLAISPLSDTIQANDSALVNLLFNGDGISAAHYNYSLMIYSNDPVNPQRIIPCQLTINGNAKASASDSCLNYGNIQQWMSTTNSFDISNTGCDTLIINNILLSTNAYSLDDTVEYILPFDQETINISFSPVDTGLHQDTLHIFTNDQPLQICLSGYADASPYTVLQPDSFQSSLICQEADTFSLHIKNAGFGDLIYNVSQYAPWMSLSYYYDTLQYNDSIEIDFIVSKDQLDTGTYTTQIFFYSNDPQLPTKTITFSLYVPNILHETDLGPDTNICIGNYILADAGANYASYLWNDGSTAQTKYIAATGSYYVDVVDSEGCTFSDTLHVTIYTYPFAHAGLDDTICEMYDMQLSGSASNTFYNPYSLQLGQSNTYSAAAGETPFNTSYMDSRSQYLFSRTELNAAGIFEGYINKLSFNVGSAGSLPMQNFTIKIGHSSSATMSGFESNVSPVYNSVSQGLVSGWNAFTLSSSFYWNGTDNIVIEVCFDNNTFDVGSSVQYSLANSKVWSNYCDNCQSGCNLTGGFLYSKRPNIIFSGTANATLYSWTGPNGFTSTEKQPLIQNFSSQHAGDYVLTVDNSLGCTGSDTVNIAVIPSPVVDAGQDTGIIAGTSMTINTSVSGGVSPYSFLWNPIVGLSSIYVQNPVASPTDTTTFTIEVTGDNGCMATDAITINIIPVYNISGQLTYDNFTNTVMENSVIVLMDTAGNPIDTASTNSNGYYTIYDKPDGDYFISGTTTKTWGGGNSTDALLIQNHVVFLSSLSGLSIYAADVNNSSSLSSTDALLVLRRTVNLDTFFLAGNWVVETDTISVNGTNLTHNLKALCMGDVNGSYTPLAVKSGAISLNNSWEKEIHKDELADIPVTINNSLAIGAITLCLEYDQESVSIYDIESTLSGLLYHITKNKVYIGWYNEDAIITSPGDTLFRIRLSLKGSSPPTRLFKLGAESEFADNSAVPISGIELNQPWLKIAEHYPEKLSIGPNFPNPFNEVSYIPYTLPETGHVKIIITDISGREINTLLDARKEAGYYLIAFHVGEMASGSYHYKLEFSAKNKEYSIIHKMIIAK